MAKIFRKTHNPYVLCAVTHSLTLKQHLKGSTCTYMCNVLTRNASLSLICYVKVVRGDFKIHKSQNAASFNSNVERSLQA